MGNTPLSKVDSHEWSFELNEAELLMIDGSNQNELKNQLECVIARKRIDNILDLGCVSDSSQSEDDCNW